MSIFESDLCADCGHERDEHESGGECQACAADGRDGLRRPGGPCWRYEPLDPFDVNEDAWREAIACGDAEAGPGGSVRWPG